MKGEFWVERWQKGEIGFHQAGGNDLLAKHWSSLGVAPEGSVFVPLCGKSVDMVWLAARGHRVVGSELSHQAVADFFREQTLSPQVRREGEFEVATAGLVTIWTGDFFTLPPAATDDIAAVYDRAALIAMPGDMQEAYARKLVALAKRAPVLLICVTYPEGQIAGPPFSTSTARVRDLFAQTHEITVLESRDGLEASANLRDRGVTELTETVYVLRPLGPA